MRRGRFIAAKAGLRQRRPPVQHEKFEQAAILQLLATCGGKNYVLGTRRSRGSACPKCGTFVAEHQGTRQTPGISDVFSFLPVRPPDLGQSRRLLVVEAKSKTGRPSPEQVEFLALCAAARVDHVCGDLDAVIAWLIEERYVTADQFPHYRQPHA